MSNATAAGVFIAVSLIVIVAAVLIVRAYFCGEREGGPGVPEGITMTRTKDSNAIDKHVGSRMRMRRMMLGWGQQKLATGLGLTFQQVQKYEKGKNRMGASRLQHAADILGVTVPFFFEGGADGPFESPSGLSPSYIDDFVTTSDGLRLAKAFMRVRPAVRRSIVDLVNEVAGEDDN
jgi:transcriptional regulator with XRE-family HTH domain